MRSLILKNCLYLHFFLLCISHILSFPSQSTVCLFSVPAINNHPPLNPKSFHATVICLAASLPLFHPSPPFGICHLIHLFPPLHRLSAPLQP